MGGWTGEGKEVGSVDEAREEMPFFFLKDRNLSFPAFSLTARCSSSIFFRSLGVEVKRGYSMLGRILIQFYLSQFSRPRNFHLKAADFRVR